VTIGLTINDKELRNLAAAFDRLDMEAVIERVVPLAGKMVQTKMAVYPPETDANRPGPYPKRWYQRHFGPRYARKAGGFGGQNTSERLQKAWRTDIIKPLEAHVFTKSTQTGGEVSYVEYVQSYESQTSVHKEHGWQTDQAVAEDVEKSAALDKAIGAAIEYELVSKLRF